MTAIIKKIVVTVAVALLVIIVLTSTSVWAYFADTETSSGNKFTAWTSTLWTQTTQTDFEAGVPVNVDISSSPGDVRLQLGSGDNVTTHSPSISAGGWSNPTNAYADGGGYASIYSGSYSSITLRSGAQSGGGTTNGSGNFSVTKPSSVSNGDYLVCIVGRDDNAGSYPTISGWTNVNAGTSTGNDTSVTISYKYISNAAGEPATYTCATEDSGEEYYYYCCALSGVDATTPQDVSFAWTNVNGVSTFTAPSVTTVTNGAFVFAVSYCDNDSDMTPPGSPWTTLLDDGVYSANNLSISYMTKSPAGATNNASFTNASNDDGYTGQFAFRPATSAASASETYGNYGFSLAGSTITQVRVKYDSWSVGAPLVVTLRGVGTNATGTTSVTCNQPSGTAADDVLVAFILDHSTTDAQSTAPTGWQGRGYCRSSSGRRFQVFTAVVGKNSLSGTSWQFSGLTSRSQGMIIGYYNADTSGYGGLDTTVSTRHNSSGTHGTTSITTVTNNSMIVAAFAMFSNGSAWSAQSCATIGNLTEEFDTAYSSYCSISVADKSLVTAGATGDSSATPSSDSYNGGILLAIKPMREYNDQIRVDVSWDGGITWSSTQNTTLTGTETTYWYDVTGAFAPDTWDATKLNDSNLRVRVDAYTQGTAEEVRLDWLPVEVKTDASAGYTSPGSITSQVLNTGTAGAIWDALIWDELLPRPSGTNITFEVRASDTSFAKDAVTPSWTSVGNTSPVTSGVPAGRYKQWRATLTTSNTANTPVLHEVRVWYDPLMIDNQK